jgi:hypothetical protein
MYAWTTTINHPGDLLTTSATTAKGWPWGKWLSAILLWFNFFMIVFFAPETRFYRPSEAPSSPDLQSSDGSIANAGEKVESEVRRLESVPLSQELGTEPSQSTMSFCRSLNPWSGIQSNGSYLELMFRPLPLLAYPACAFATLICQ